MILHDAKSQSGRKEGLLTAQEELDERVKKSAFLEDDQEGSRLIRCILQAEGDFYIQEAHVGRSGLALIRKTRPHLILLDLMKQQLLGSSP